MFYVYILLSKINNKFYVGQTFNLQKRLLYHNSGFSKSTKGGIPWEFVYCEKYNTRIEATRREKEIKSHKSRKYIEKIIAFESVPIENREVQEFDPP